MNTTVVIGITECGKWDRYSNWVKLSGAPIETLKLSWRENEPDLVGRCDAIILSGGEDVHPRFYGAPERISELDPREINEQRDEFELRVIDAALKQALPILGICRGLQIANVYFGGTLIPDLPNAGKLDHSKLDGCDRMHMVSVSKNTELEKIVGTNRGEVNSSHHQAAEKIGAGLRVSAVSDDGIIEGLEWQDPDGKSFLQLVQWHPERMENGESPFSKSLLQEFIQTTHIISKSQPVLTRPGLAR